MSNCTNRIKLPYIVQSQSQKEVTHNASLEIIDILLHPTVIDIGINAPPESPKTHKSHTGDSYTQNSHTDDSNTGTSDTQDSSAKYNNSRDCYIVGSTPRGAWEGHADALAYSENGAWKFIDPFEGLMVWVRDKKQHYIYDGLRWFSIFEVIEK